MFSNLKKKSTKLNPNSKLLGLIGKCSGGELLHACVLLVFCIFFLSTCFWVLLEALSGGGQETI